MKTASRSAAGFLIIVLVAGRAPSLPGAVLNWTNTSGGNWGASTNWDPNQVPGATDTAMITAAGTYTVTANAGETIASLTLGGTSGAQTLDLSSGTFNLSGTATVNANGALDLSGATLAGSGTWTINGPFDWTSGTVGNTGGLTLNGTSSLSGASAGSMTLSTVLNNSGQLTWSGSANNLYFVSATITNLAAGTITFAGGGSPAYDGGNDTIDNAGLLIKAGTNTTTFSSGVSFTNTGAVQVQSGILNISCGGAATGTFAVSSNATLQFANNYSLGAGSSVAGAGAVLVSSGMVSLLGSLALSGTNTISGGTLAVMAPATMSVSNLALTGGTLSGNAPATVNGPFNWTSGTMSDTGGLMLNGISSLNGPGTGSMTLGGPLNNAGQLTWSGSGGNLYLTSGTITNLSGGTITIAADVSAIYDGGNNIIDNAGLLLKTGGTGTTALNAAFVNTGDVQVQSGVLSLPSGGTNAGTIEVSNIATLQFPNNYTLSAGSSVSGGGAVLVSSGTLTVLGNLSASGTNTITGGALLVNSPGTVSVSNLFLTGGTLGGNAPVTLNGVFNWTGGTMANTGGLMLNGASSLNGPGTGSLTLNGVINNAGQLTWSGGGGNLYLTSATITNQPGGTITIAADVSAEYDGGNNTIANAGLLRKTGGTNTTSLNATFVNTGDVQVQSGAISLPGGGSATGSFEMSANTELQFANNYALSPVSSVTGAGTVDFASGVINASGTYNPSGQSAFAGATVNFSGNYTISGQPVTVSSGTVNFNAGGTLNLSALTISGGTLGGSNAVPVSGPFNWTSGTMANTGGLLLNGTSSLNGPSTGTMTLNGVLNNAGQLTWSGSGGNLYLASATITNQPGGTITIATDVSAEYDGGNNTIANAGLLRKTGGTNTTSLNATFVNTGDVQIQSGAISLPGGGSATGSFEVSANAELQFADNYTLSAASSMTGAGTVDFASGTINASGTYNPSGQSVFAGATVNFSGNYTISGQPVTIYSGTVNFNAGGTLNLGALTIIGGTLGGSNAVPVNGPFNWTNGTVANTGGLLLNGTSSLSGPGTGSMTLNGTINNAGQLTWSGTGGNLYLGSATITNQPGGTIIITTDVSAQYDGGNNVIANAGLLRKTGGTGTTALNATVVNSGTIDAQKGTLQFPGSLTLLSSNVLNFGLNGAGGVAGTDFGVISFTGNGALNLAGTLSANLNNGFVPPVGTSFNALTYASEAGNFAATKLPALAVWQTNAGTASYSIKVLKWVPMLAWSAPAPIVYGTALGNLQLDATAASPTNLAGSLAGVFNYTPSAGTILDSGNQTLSVTFTPSDASDYTNVSTNVMITVQKAPLTVTATNQIKTYGQTVAFAGTEFTDSGLVNGDTLSSVTLASAGAAATANVASSPYSIAVSGAVGTSLTNYIITYQNGTLTVNPAALAITASNASKYFGQALTFAGKEFAAAGLQNSETVGSVTLSSAGAAATAVAGTYPIIPSAAAGGTFTPGNYAISYVNGTLTVNPLPVLQIVASGNAVVLSWTTNSTGFALQTTGNLSASGSWVAAPGAVTVIGGQNTVTDTIGGGAGFYRLKF